MVFRAGSGRWRGIFSHPYNDRLPPDLPALAHAGVLGPSGAWLSSHCHRVAGPGIRCAPPGEECVWGVEARYRSLIQPQTYNSSSSQRRLGPRFNHRHLSDLAPVFRSFPLYELGSSLRWNDDLWPSLSSPPWARPIITASAAERGVSRPSGDVVAVRCLEWTGNNGPGP